jgi:glycosyltransferase involved in cell wall biosynthesis
MKIALPQLNCQGGATTWRNLFERFLTAKGYQTTANVLDDNYDVLVNMADILSVTTVTSLARRGVKILYRMDGLFWEYLSNPQASAARNETLKKMLLTSNAIVFQSYFVKKVSEKLMNREIAGEVIYNAADPRLFSPDGARFSKPSGQKLILAGGNWGPLPLALPVLKKTLAVAKTLAKEPLQIGIFGNIPQEALNKMKQFLDLPNVNLNYLRQVDHQTMPQFLRTADLLLYLRPNDPCPNLIIEALHCGTPIVGLASGSLPELVGDSCLLGNCEATTKHFPAMDLDDICRKVRATLNDLPKFRAKVLLRSKYFSAATMGERYLRRIKSLVPKE